jgi:hypothetical protein
MLFSASLLVNKVGLSKESDYYEEVDGLCGINISTWYIEYTSLVAIKLLLTVFKYYSLKNNRKENISLTIIDLLAINLLFSGLFIKANILYFSKPNLCWYTSDNYVRSFYLLFCFFTVLGYL